MPQLRPRIRGRARSGSPGVGRGRRRDGGRRLARPPVPRSGRRGGADARRPDRCAGTQPAGAARSSSEAAAAPTSARSAASPRAPGASRWSGSTRTETSTRLRARRPATPGGCRCADGDRRGLRAARGRRPRRRPQSRSARARLPSTPAGSTTMSTGRSTECDRVYVALDCDVLRPGRARGLHARAGRPDLAETESMLRGDRRSVLRWPASGLTGLTHRRDPSRVVARLAAAAGL